ncbi:HAD family hydrolase [Leptolyngbya sp. AN02str]|uniref:HAD family hydrolase n=1 Tax=Leptolyngbya sp. AN02str TaxID=3423363 RepID=UPI003D310F35
MAVIRCNGVVFSNIKTILFDKDGTLANVEQFLWKLGHERSRWIDSQVPGLYHTLMSAFGISGQNFHSQGLMAVGTRQENEIAAAAYVAATGKAWVQAVDLVHHAFVKADQHMASKAEQTPPFPGIVELLHRLHQLDVQLGIVSSDHSENIADFLQVYGLNALFQHYIGAQAGVSKPNPIFVHQACAALHAEPASTLIIGDSSADIEMARLAHTAGAIAALWAWQDVTELPNASAIVSSISQIEVLP